MVLSLAAGLALAGLALWVEGMLPPDELRPALTLLYRPVFWLLLPPRLAAQLLFPYVGHHYPPAHWVTLTLLAPLYLWGLVELARRLLLNGRRRRDRIAVETQVDSSRREFLRRGLLAGGGVGVGAVGGFAVLIEPARIQVRHYRIAIADLPPALEGLRLAHISDTHYGPYVTMPYLREVVGLVNRLAPDLVVLTGDYVHRSPRSVLPGIGVLGGFEARLGAAAVLGNHDHWEGADLVRGEFSRLGVPLLDNDRLFLTAAGLGPEPAAGALCLAGVGDLWEDRVDGRAALGGVPAEMPRLLLAHNPDSLDRLGASRRIDLAFCGHTHGGQVAIPLIGPPIVPIRNHAYAGGLAQGPAGAVITSRGVGMAFLPLRFNVPPELGLIELVRG